MLLAGEGDDVTQLGQCHAPILRRVKDLPSWFALDSERIAALIVGKPDYETRAVAAQQLVRLFPGFQEADPAQRAEAVRRYADGTDGLTLTALADIAQLAIRQNIDIADVEDAVRDSSAHRPATSATTPAAS